VADRTLQESNLGAPTIASSRNEAGQWLRRHPVSARGAPPGYSANTTSPDEYREALPGPVTRDRDHQIATSTTEGTIAESPSGDISPMPIPRTPSRFRIYNDSLPASSQPQTPQNLPEARHQSRLRGSYTVPARHTSYPIRTPTTGRLRRHLEGRNPSPPGLREPGFMGLYGGVENTDDSILFARASGAVETDDELIQSSPASPR